MNQRNTTNFPTEIPFEFERVVAGMVTRDFEAGEILIVKGNELNGSQSGNMRLTAGIGKRYNCHRFLGFAGFGWSGNLCGSNNRLRVASAPESINVARIGTDDSTN